MNLLDLMVRIGIDDQVTSKIGSVAGGIKNGLASAARASAAAAAAVGAGVVALGSQALDAYADFEQLAGGVAKLYGNAGMSVEEYAASVNQSVEEVQSAWEKNERAQELVMENARQAYRTAGMDMNTYMETATTFSASLIDSLGGDTERAAQVTDVAMRAISDNYNTFGGDMELIENAFKGFSKNNFAMLDNLKLGYGGTRSEMERLIADANAWAEANGEAADLSIDSFADMVTAVDYIQRKQQIAGTTAREAATTIEGSLNMTKAAWRNLLAEFGKKDGNVGQRMEELVESATTFLLGAVDENGEKISDGAIGVFERIVSGVVEVLPEAIPRLVEAASALFGAIATAIMTVGPSLISALSNAIRGLISQVRSNLPQMMSAGAELIMQIGSAIAKSAPSIISDLLSLLIDMVGYVITHIPDMFMAANELIFTFLQAIAQTDIVQAINDFIQGAVDKVGEFFTDMYNAGAHIIEGLIEGIKSMIDSVGDTILGGISGAVDGVKNFLGIKSPSKLFADIGKNTMLGMAEGIDGEAGTVEKAMDAAMSLVSDAGSATIGLNANMASNGILGPQSTDSVAGMLLAEVQSLHRDMANMKLYIDSRVAGGVLAPEMNRQLGLMEVANAR